MDWLHDNCWWIGCGNGHLMSVIVKLLKKTLFTFPPLNALFANCCPRKNLLFELFAESSACKRASTRCRLGEKLAACSLPTGLDRCRSIRNRRFRRAVGWPGWWSAAPSSAFSLQCIYDSLSLWELDDREMKLITEGKELWQLRDDICMVSSLCCVLVFTSGGSWWNWPGWLRNFICFFLIILVTTIGGRSKPGLYFLPGRLRWTLLPKERYGNSLSGCGSNTQPSSWRRTLYHWAIAALGQ